MAVIQVNAWECDVCGYVWLKVAGRIPTHCASRKCRSRKWNEPTAIDVQRVIGKLSGHAACDPDYAMPLRPSVPVPRASPTRYIHDVKTCRVYGCLMCKDAKA